MDDFRRAGWTEPGFFRQLGVRIPVLNAPMGEAASEDLVAAVSLSGGLGVVPAAEMHPEDMERFVASVRQKTPLPLALNLRPCEARPARLEAAQKVLAAFEPVMESLGIDPKRMAELLLHPPKRDFARQFEAALDLHPCAVTSSFGAFREEEAEKLARAGIRSITTVTTLREAKVARSAGSDALIVQGAEAAGPRLSFESPDSEMVGLSALLPAVRRATGLPVLASGGVADPLQAEGLQHMGASGLVLGTALLACGEARVPPRHRWFARHGSTGDLMTTRLWTGRLMRTVRSDYLEGFSGFEPGEDLWPLLEAPMRVLSEAAQKAGTDALTPMPLGQSLGRSPWRSAARAVESLGNPERPGAEYAYK